MSEKKSDKVDLDKVVDQLVDAVMESLEGGYTNPMLPFDAYVKKTKLKVKENIKEFRMRLRKGYLVLLYALRDKKGISVEEKKEVIKNIISNQINSLSGDFRILP